MSSLTEQQPPLLQDVVNNMRDNILRSQSQASTVAITSYDGIVEQLAKFGAQLNDNNVEILRLQELCKKNNIDYAIPPQIISPAPSTQRISNPTPESVKPKKS